MSASDSAYLKVDRLSSGRIYADRLSGGRIFNVMEIKI